MRTMIEDISLPSLDEREHLPWIALTRVHGLGCAGFKRVADHLDDPRQVFWLSEKELRQIPGLDRQAIEGILSFSNWNEVREEMGRIFESGVRIVPFSDANYPPRLRMIPDPSPFLYVKGEIRDGDENAVAVVGSRSASEYGLRITRDLCRGLASLGLTVVSGMALGIDGEAHQEAIGVGGRTVAVLGSGVDVAYPWEHKALYQTICQHGAVLSELPMGTPPFSYNFPTRNRIISGISLGVVVVEATERSGSLITARLAVEQGREVFAVPGQAGASRSRGTHRLIRQGAKLVDGIGDIIEEIAPQFLSQAGRLKEVPAPTLPPDTSPEVRKVFELVQRGPIQIDEVIQASGLSPAQVSGILLDLEIKGYLRQLPGKRFRIN